MDDTYDSQENNAWSLDVLSDHALNSIHTAGLGFILYDTLICVSAGGSKYSQEKTHQEGR